MLCLLERRCASMGYGRYKALQSEIFEKTALHMVATKLGPESYFSALTVAS